MSAETTAVGASEPRRMTPEEGREYLRKIIEQARTGLQETHGFSRFSQEHSDKMLTWAIGLMGVGLASGYTLLVHAPWRLQCLALLPWGLGVLAALAGRILGAEYRNRNDEYYSAMIAALGLASAEDDPGTIRKMYSEVIRGKEPTCAPLKDSANRFLRRANGLYYATHALFGFGVIAVGLVLVIVGPKGDLGAQLRRDCESIVREYMRGQEPPWSPQKDEPATKFCIERRAGLEER